MTEYHKRIGWKFSPDTPTIIGDNGQKIVDLKGKIFGRLTVVAYSGINNKKWHVWRCICNCGKEITIPSKHLNGGKVISCGCRRKETLVEFGNHYSHFWKGKHSCNRLPDGEASFRHVLASYKAGAKGRGLAFSLSEDQFRNLTKMRCAYCGTEPDKTYRAKNAVGSYTYIGVDRCDNSAGYTVENSVPCCTVCNRSKRDMTISDFAEWVRKVYSFWAAHTVE